MSYPGILIRHLAFTGPNRKTAIVAFASRLNVVYGASDTGKSFIVECIDFMFGGRATPRDIPERVGYDRILLGIQAGDTSYTLVRSPDGGRIAVYEGLLDEVSSETKPLLDLSEQHSEKREDNLSSFLLEKCGLSNKRIRRNKMGDTNSLSFRNLARLLIVTETEITEQRSPLQDGNPTADTPNFATFKLLLTGVDDEALIARKAAAPEEQSKEAQIEILDELIGDYRQRLKEISRQPAELDEQLQKLENTLLRQTVQLDEREKEYRGLSTRRRELRQRLETVLDRKQEIDGLLDRFDLLERHYRSDTLRLKSIEEAGTMFVALGGGTCPLCGSSAEHYNAEAVDCGGDVGAVVEAARSEIEKIENLGTDLSETVKLLRREAGAIERVLPRAREDLEEISGRIEVRVSPALSKMRATYAEVADKRGEVREALAVLRGLEDIERRRADLFKAIEGDDSSSLLTSDLPTSVADEFAKLVGEILTAWHFPNADRVHFDAKKRDLVIGGKLRTARGKGLRAITHAAFSIGLLEFCRNKKSAHPGFVVLDSPLLAYRAPESDEDDLRDTDLKDQFYAYLSAIPNDQQVIIVENTDPTQEVKQSPTTVFFTGNQTNGRFGFFDPDPIDRDLLNS